MCCHRMLEDGGEISFCIARPGDMIGSCAPNLMGRGASCATAITDSVLYELGEDELVELINANSALGLHLLEQFAESLSEFENVVHDLSFKATQARLAGALLRLSASAASCESEPGNISLCLSQRDLVSFIGASRASTSIAMNTLRRNGIITYTAQKIAIRDCYALRLLAKDCA